jgi:hypothetical protein
LLGIVIRDLISFNEIFQKVEGACLVEGGLKDIELPTGLKFRIASLVCSVSCISEERVYTLALLEILSQTIPVPVANHTLDFLNVNLSVASCHDILEVRFQVLEHVSPGVFI